MRHYSTHCRHTTGDRAMSITFKAKPIQLYNHDDTPSYQVVKIPKLTRQHCDMAALRKRSDRLGQFANSDLFENLLRRTFKERFGQHTEAFRLDQLPDGVSVELGSLLATVKVQV